MQAVRQEEAAPRATPAGYSLNKFSGKAEKGTRWKREGQMESQRSCLIRGRKEERQKRSEEEEAV